MDLSDLGGGRALRKAEVHSVADLQLRSRGEKVALSIIGEGKAAAKLMNGVQRCEACLQLSDLTGSAFQA